MRQKTNSSPCFMIFLLVYRDFTTIFARDNRNPFCPRNKRKTQKEEYKQRELSDPSCFLLFAYFAGNLIKTQMSSRSEPPPRRCEIRFRNTADQRYSQSCRISAASSSLS